MANPENSFGPPEIEESSRSSDSGIASIAQSLWQEMTKAATKDSPAEASDAAKPESNVLDFSTGDIFKSLHDSVIPAARNALDAMQEAQEAPLREAAQERERLERSVDSGDFLEDERADFRKDIARFEERARTSGLDPKEITATYKAVSELMSATGDEPLSEWQRQTLARQVMRHAADPTSVDQGSFSTCNVATVESRIYTRNPSAAADVVSQVARTGEYVTKTGLTVDLHPNDLQPLGDSFYEPMEGSWGRTYASQMFAVAAVNIHYEGKNALPGATQQLRYENKDIDPTLADDTGERIIDYISGSPVVVNGTDGTPRRSPGLTDSDIVDVSNVITGTDSFDVLLRHQSIDMGDAHKNMEIDSYEKLETTLAHLKENGQLPAIVQVFTGTEPLWTDSGEGSAGGSGGSDGGSHVITVVDYDPGSSTVELDNQWGESADHLGQKSIPVRDLYAVMREPQDEANREELRELLAFDREHGQADVFMELELLRLDNKYSSRSNADLDTELAEKMIECNWKWQQEDALGIGNQEERNRLIDKIQEVKNLLPSDRQRTVQQTVDSFFNPVPGSHLDQWVHASPAAG